MIKSKELLRNYIIYSNLAVKSSNISSVSLKSFLCTETTKDVELTCWKCHKTLSTRNLFCKFCSSVQKLEEQNYYDLFDLKFQFLINKRDLSKKFKHLQSQLHPDKFSTKNQVGTLTLLIISVIIWKEGFSHTGTNTDRID